MLRSRDLEELEAWLVERALEHEAPKVLFRLARERSRTGENVHPGRALAERREARAWAPSRARWPNWRFSASWEPMSGTSAI